jgi:hypothetical protein
MSKHTYMETSIQLQLEYVQLELQQSLITRANDWALSAGTDLAQVLTTKDKIAKTKSAMSSDVAKALARISSGLYVVTAAHNNARSAMVASWVSQVTALASGSCQ